MKQLIAVLVLVIGIFGCSTLEEKKEQARWTVESAAWLDMCQLLIDEEVGYHCGRLMPPLVVYEEMDDGLYGWYEGTEYIYINSSLTGTDLFDVLMHEGIHYVHVQLQIVALPGPTVDACWSENEAWTLTGSFWNEDNSDWWRAYPHCWPYYADQQSLREYGEVWNWINGIIDGIVWEN